jgi:hypothetical protein
MKLTLGIWQERTLVLLTKAYMSIPPEKAAEYLGLANDVVVSGMLVRVWGKLLMIVLQHEKWTYDTEKNLLMPAKVVKRMTLLGGGGWTN